MKFGDEPREDLIFFASAFSELSFFFVEVRCENLGTNDDTQMYSDSCKTSKMELLAKIVNGFREKLHLRCLTGFWIRLWYGQRVTKQFRSFSSSNEVSCKITLPKNFSKLIGKHPCRISWLLWNFPEQFFRRTPGNGAWSSKHSFSPNTGNIFWFKSTIETLEKKVKYVQS